VTDKRLSPAMRALYAEGREAAEALLPRDAELGVFEAAAFGRLERLADLLSAHPELVNAYSSDGFTPLHLACFSGGSEATRLLIERGADLEALAQASFARVRPLGTAAFSRDHERARALLEAGADPNARAEGGFTPLHSAAQNGDVELVRLLLRYGGDRSVAAADGRKPVDLAREAGHEECAALLGSPNVS
jgi:uncharacterized protein